MSSGFASCATPVPHKPIVNAAISMALGCSIAGPVDPREVIKLVEKCLEAGVDFVAIADTVGYAGPKQVGELTRAAVKMSGAKPVCVHLHDTRGMGIANASAALDAGARILDGSLGGLGGCPFAPGATGNVVFEDLVFLCESKGFPHRHRYREAGRGARDPAVGNAGRDALWRACPRRAARQEIQRRRLRSGELFAVGCGVQGEDHALPVAIVCIASSAVVTRDFPIEAKRGSVVDAGSVLTEMFG